MKKLFALVLTCFISLSMSLYTVSAAEVESGSDDPYSGVGSYMAFFQCQTTSWVYRNNFEDKNTGYGSDIFKTVYNNETDAATSTVINDTVIDGDGEYTISLNDISFEGSTDFNMIAISTNIPLDAGIEVTAAVLKYDSRTITSTFAQKNDNKDYVHIMLINQYDQTMKDTVNTLVPADGSDITITFTVTGFGYEKTIEDQATTTDSSEATVTPATDETTTDDTAVTGNESSVNDETTANNEEDSDSSLSTGAVIGIIAGIVVVAVVLIVVFVKKKK